MQKNFGRIFITGDTHADVDWHKLNTNIFTQGKGLTKNDFVIVCGDFGGVWDGDITDKYVQNWYNNQPWTTLFVDGNHENFDLLNQYPVEEWNGGKVHKISDSIYHLMRGQIYEINGKKIFTFGGAESTDKAFRVPYVSWWPQEIPNYQECVNALSNLENCGYKVDYIITHCAPSRFEKVIYGEGYKSNNVTEFLDIACDLVEYKAWYCGHHHLDVDMNNYNISFMYNRIIELNVQD